MVSFDSGPCDKCNTFSNAVDFNLSMILENLSRDFQFQGVTIILQAISDSGRTMAESRGLWWSLFRRIVLVDFILNFQEYFCSTK